MPCSRRTASRCLHPLALFRGAAGHRAEQHQPAHAVRVVQRDALRDHAAQREPHDVRRGHRAGIQHIDDVADEVVQRQCALDVSRLPMPAQVETQYAEVGREVGSDVVPARAVRADTVDQHDRRPIATLVPVAQRRGVPPVQRPLCHCVARSVGCGVSVRSAAPCIQASWVDARHAPPLRPLAALHRPRSLGCRERCVA